MQPSVKNVWIRLERILAHKRLRLLLLRALPEGAEDSRLGVKCDLDWTVRHGAEPWYVSWQRVQKSKRQLERVHVALCSSCSSVAGEPQHTHLYRNSCRFRRLAAWTENKTKDGLVKELQQQKYNNKKKLKNHRNRTPFLRIKGTGKNINIHLHKLIVARTLRRWRAALLWCSSASHGSAALIGWGGSAPRGHTLQAGQHRPGLRYIPCQTTSEPFHSSVRLLKSSKGNIVNTWLQHMCRWVWKCVCLSHFLTQSCCSTCWHLSKAALFSQMIFFHVLLTFLQLPKTKKTALITLSMNKSHHKLIYLF